MNEGLKNPSGKRLEMPRIRLENATTSVRTATLSDHGVEKLRVVSESKFLDLVHSLVEESIKEHICEQPPGSRSTVEIERIYEGKWSSLKTQHEESLHGIETKMERLAKAFKNIEHAFEKLGKRAAKEAPIKPCAPPAPSAKDLLRQMLLDEKKSA